MLINISGDHNCIFSIYIKYICLYLSFFYIYIPKKNNENVKIVCNLKNFTLNNESYKEVMRVFRLQKCFFHKIYEWLVSSYQYSFKNKHGNYLVTQCKKKRKIVTQFLQDLLKTIFFNVVWEIYLQHINCFTHCYYLFVFIYLRYFSSL